MSEYSEDDQEDDQAWNPRESLVGVDDFIAEHCDDEGGGCDNDNSSPARHVVIDGIEKLSADNNINGRPTNAG